MEIQGKVIKILGVQSGESARGVWKKQEFILETPGQYPKKICIEIWGDKIEQINIQEGEEITASINIESREFNERWYTNIKAWKVQRGMHASNPSASVQSSENTPPPPTAADMPAQADQIEDDLPF